MHLAYKNMLIAGRNGVSKCLYLFPSGQRNIILIIARATSLENKLIDEKA